MTSTEGRLDSGCRWGAWLVEGPAGHAVVRARDLETALEAVGLSAGEADEIHPACCGGFRVIFRGAEFILRPRGG